MNYTYNELISYILSSMVKMFLFDLVYLYWVTIISKLFEEWVAHYPILEYLSNSSGSLLRIRCLKPVELLIECNRFMDYNLIYSLCY